MKGTITIRYEISGVPIVKNSLYFKSLPYDEVEYDPETMQITKIISRPSRLTIGDVQDGYLTLPLLSTTFKIHVKDEMDGIYMVNLPGMTISKPISLHEALVKVYLSVDIIQGYRVEGVSPPLYTKHFQDLSGLETFNVDPVGSVDFDDAISLEFTDKGELTKIYTHIVDINHGLKPGSMADLRALSLGMTFYNPEETVHLTDNFAELSLIKGIPRRVITTEFHIMGDELLSYEIYPSEIVIKHRYDYSNFNPPLALTRFVEKRRYGSLINIPKLNMSVRDGKVIEYGLEYLNDTNHRIVETLMVMTNMIIANHLYGKGVSFPSRFHPVERKQIEDFYHPNPIVKSYIILKNYSKAYYSVDSFGHHALNLEQYTHFTSPLRRYPDVIVHRLLAGYRYPDMNEIIDKLNRREELIEKICMYYETHMKKTIPGNSPKYIIQISQAGITVLDPELLICDFIHVSKLKPVGKYVFRKESGGLLVGDVKSFRLGDIYP